MVGQSGFSADQTVFGAAVNDFPTHSWMCRGEMEIYYKICLVTPRPVATTNARDGPTNPDKCH